MSWKMVEMPWVTVGAVEPDREYLAMITYIPRKSFWYTIPFLRAALKIQRQLRGSEGIVGFSMRMRLVRKDAWTLSVWSDEVALARFVGRAPHSTLMRELRPHLGDFKRANWKISGSAVPIEWDDALRRLLDSGAMRSPAR